MSTTESKVEKLLRHADQFIADDLECNNGRSSEGALVKALVEVIREYHPIVNPPAPATENPNVTAWRDIVNVGLKDAVHDLQTILGAHVKITASTFVRRSVMKDGGVKAKLGIKFEAKTVYNRAIDPVKIIQRHINDRLKLNGLPQMAVLTTSGSQMSFNARVYVEGDEDYSTWVRIGRL